MKILALVQSEQWLNRAGVRIRYRRMSPALESFGASIRVDMIDSVKERGSISEDVVILSKLRDSRAPVVADYLRERGILVGVDMFDDYFSSGISPCDSHREFLRDIAPRIDFFLASTERMREVAASFAPGKPSHVLNDPFDTLDEALLADRLAEKAAKAKADKRFDVLWFGNGDNPVFPVGLTDLASYAAALRPFTRSGYEVRLKILTNLGALHAENLARLRALGMPLTITEWSEDGEAQAMEEAFVSFLPVNHQNFSIAKSLNRGISALTGGTQVLSAGFDLYAAIGPVIYRDSNDLLVDLGVGRLRLRPQTLPLLKECMDDLADPANEARKLVEFLRGLPSLAEGRSHAGCAGSVKVMVHGNRSSHAVLAFANDRDIISIASPFCNSTRNFNVAFDFRDDTGQLEIRLDRMSAGMITASMKSLLREDTSRDQTLIFVMDLPDDEEGRLLRALRPHMVKTRAGQMVHYARVMGAIDKMVRRLLPQATIYRSEQASPLMGIAHLDRRSSDAVGAQRQ